MVNKLEQAIDKLAYIVLTDCIDLDFNVNIDYDQCISEMKEDLLKMEGVDNEVY